MSTETMMDPTLARRIIQQAREDDTLEGPIPADDEQAIAKATELVEMARLAWSKNVRGPEVEAILRLEAEGFDGSSDPEPQPEPEVDEETPQTMRGDLPAAEPDMAALAAEEPWEDYSSERVPDIVDALEWAAAHDEDWQDLAMHVWAYETAHKNRATIIKALDRLAQEANGGEEQAAAPQGAGDAEGAAALEADAGAEGGVEGGEGDGEEAGDAQPEAPDDELNPELPVGDEPQPIPPVTVSEPVEDQPDPAREPITDLEVQHVSIDTSGPEPVPGPMPPSGPPPVQSEAGLEDDLAGLDEEIEAMLARERLHVPPRLEVEPVEMPFDLTTLSDKGVQTLHGVFAAYAYRAAYLYMMDEARSRHCREAADEIAQALMVGIDKIDPQTGKPKTMTLIEAEVEQDPNVRKWRRRARKFDAFAQAYRHERDQYQRYVEALSRHETMRHNEWERSGGGRKR